MAARKEKHVASPAVPPREPTACLRLKDSDSSYVPVGEFLGGRGLGARERWNHKGDLGRRLAERVLELNADRLLRYGIRGRLGFHDDRPVLEVLTGTDIGAFPLRSPTTGRDDIPVVIEPRFSWTGLSAVLGGCGFAAVPSIEPLPMLPRSEREIPPWVLSSIVLDRVGRLLAQMQRRFAFVESDLHQPRGTLQLGRWAVKNLPTGRATTIPCRYPDLRDDEEVLSALHWTLLRHRGSLESQRSHGMAVRRLLARCSELLELVRTTPPRRPTPRVLGADSRLAPVARAALESVGWTVDERGLAGRLADLGGLPWRLSMETAFEAWVEAAARELSRTRAATVASGREGQTRTGLRWQARASMGALVPDVVVRERDTVMVIDAKYKAYWAAVVGRGWNRAPELVKEAHRADLHQVLAYAATFADKRVIACLAYPIRPGEERDDSGVRRGRVETRRGLELALVGMPLTETGIQETAQRLARVLSDRLD